MRLLVGNTVHVADLVELGLGIALLASASSAVRTAVSSSGATSMTCTPSGLPPFRRQTRPVMIVTGGSSLSFIARFLI
jgi:hypothetical protein